MTQDDTIAEIEFLWDRHTIVLHWLRRQGLQGEWDKRGCLHFTTRVPLEVEVKLCLKAHMEEVARGLKTKVVGYVITKRPSKDEPFLYDWTVSFLDDHRLLQVDGDVVAA